MTDDQLHKPGGGEEEYPLRPPPHATLEAYTHIERESAMCIYPFINLLNHKVMTPSQQSFSVPMKKSSENKYSVAGSSQEEQTLEQKIHKGFKYQGHQLLGYFQGLQGALLLNPLRHKSNKRISLT